VTTSLQRRAGFWIRAAAALLDLCVGFLPAVVLAAVAVTFLEDRLSEPATNRLYAGLLLSLFLAYTSLEVWIAATPGKMLLRLVIAAPGGAPADRWTLALRWSTKYAPLLLGLEETIAPSVLAEFLRGLVTSVVTVGLLQSLDEHKRTWHDEWAGTAVYHKART
jgi:uncharacterized RDD family membrane protein YckC